MIVTITAAPGCCIQFIVGHFTFCGQPLHFLFGQGNAVLFQNGQAFLKLGNAFEVFNKRFLFVFRYLGQQVINTFFVVPFFLLLYNAASAANRADVS